MSAQPSGISPRQHRSARSTRNLSRLLLVLGVPLLVLGAYGVGAGILTWTWPRTGAVILQSRVDLRESTHTLPGSDKYQGGRTKTRETASFHVRYRYRVDGRDYEAGGVEPADFGLQKSAASRAWGTTYAPGQQVMIAYDPRDAARAYLRPGPSSPALILTAAGGVLALSGLWLRRR